MALATECPHCGAQLSIDASLRGKKVRCEDCGDAFIVGKTSSVEAGSTRIRETSAGSSSTRARNTSSKRRPRSEEEDDYRVRRSSSSGTPTGFIVGLCVGGALLVVGLIVAVVVVANRSE